MILTSIALIKYPAIFNGTVGIVIAAVIIYVVLWTILKPDNFSRNGGLIIAALFILGTIGKDLVDWTSHEYVALATRYLIYIEFAIISFIQTTRTNNIYKGVKSSLASALLGIMITVCAGFLICYFFTDRMLYILAGHPKLHAYGTAEAFMFFNTFQNASNVMIIGPLISIIIGAVAGATAMIVRKMKK